MVSIQPVRKLKPNNRSLTGWVSCRDGRSVPFESSLERDLIIVLDFNLNTESIHAQPFTIDYVNDEGRNRFYTPDFLAIKNRLDNSADALVYEVKYREDLRENWRKYKSRFKAARRYCRCEGMSFCLVTEREIRTPLVQTATFLRRYRTYQADEATEIELIRGMKVFDKLEGCTPNSLLQASYAYQPNRAKAIAHLWRLMDSRRILFEEDVPLTMNSNIWLREEEW